MANHHLRGPVFLHQIKYRDGCLALNLENDIKTILEEAGCHLVCWEADGSTLKQMILDQPDNTCRVAQSLFWQFLAACDWFPHEGVDLPSQVLDVL